MILGLGVWVWGGCQVSRGPNTFDTDDPARKVPAIKSAGEGKKQAELVKLVGALESNDPGVRFFAIQSLEKRTGETLGYRYYDPEGPRAKAVERWKAYLAGEKGEGATTREAGL